MKKNNLNKKFEIKIVTQGCFPDFTAVGELLYELALKLKKDYGIDVTILTTQPGVILKNKLPSTEMVDGVKIRRFSTTKFNKNKLTGKIFNSWIFFFKILIHSLFSKKTDCYIFSTSPPLAPFIGAVLKILKKQKYIYKVDDIYPEIAWKLGYIKKNGSAHAIWNYLTHIAYKYADKVIVLSEDMEKEIIKQFPVLKEKNIKIIPHWADEEKIKPVLSSENYMVDKLNLRNKFIVEYSGNIGRVHEFKTFINAAEKLREEKDIVFLFIGDGGKKPEVENMVNQKNLDNVIFLPYRTRSELSYSLSIGHVHLVSLGHGFESLSAPSKLYGILAVSKPYIYLGNYNYLSKLIKEYHCGYDIRTGDHDNLVNVIKELKNSIETLEKMGENSRKLFEEEFTLKKNCKKYYETIVAT